MVGWCPGVFFEDLVSTFQSFVVFGVLVASLPCSISVRCLASSFARCLRVVMQQLTNVTWLTQPILIPQDQAILHLNARAKIPIRGYIVKSSLANLVWAKDSLPPSNDDSESLAVMQHSFRVLVGSHRPTCHLPTPSLLWAGHEPPGLLANRRLAGELELEEENL